MVITEMFGGNTMNNSELHNMIEKYKEELLKYANENGGYVKSDIIEKMPEAKTVVSVIDSQDKTGQEADITELEGTNPTGYNAGRTEPTYRDVNEFRNENSGNGTLKVQAFSGREAFPIVSARVVVTKDFDTGIQTFADELTDTSGIVEGIRLIAPQKGSATENNEVLPYSTYTIRVTHPYFVTTVYTNVPMFDGVTSIQPANMLPKTGTPTDDSEIVYVDEEPKDL